MYFDEKIEFVDSEIVGSNYQNLKNRFYYLQKFKNYVGSKILDVGCCDGRWSAWALDIGAKFVHGIDKEPSYIDKANLIFEKHFKKNQYKFECVNWKDFSCNEKYDSIFLFGLLYYNDQENLIKKCSELSDTILVDTNDSNEFCEYHVDESIIGQDTKMITLPTSELFKLFEKFNYTIENIHRDKSIERIFFVAKR